jgi:hypothetical protein
MINKWCSEIHKVAVIVNFWNQTPVCVQSLYWYNNTAKSWFKISQFKIFPNFMFIFCGTGQNTLQIL